MTVTRSSLTARMDGGWEIASDWLGADVSVSTLATLDSFADYDNTYRALKFIFKVTGTHAAAFVIDQSEDGTTVEDVSDGSIAPEVPCAAGKQKTFTVHDIGGLAWRVSAYSTEGGNPATTVNRRILGRRTR